MVIAVDVVVVVVVVLVVVDETYDRVIDQQRARKECGEYADCLLMFASAAHAIRIRCEPTSYPQFKKQSKTNHFCLGHSRSKTELELISTKHVSPGYR